MAHPQVDDYALIEPHMHEIIAQALDEYADRQEGRIVFIENMSKEGSRRAP